MRGEINWSDSLSRVSLEADLTFRALIVAVDDFGRTDGRPAALKALLFPMRSTVTEAKVMRWIEELAEDGCVQRYEAEGRPYICLTGWEKHRGKGRRAESSRYPDPPEILGNPRKSEDCVGNPPVLRGTWDEKREARDEKRDTPRAPRSDGVCLCPDELADDEWEKLFSWAEPQRFSRVACRKAFERVRDWSHTSRKKRSRWWVVVKNAMQDGWALGPKGREPPKSWAEVESEKNKAWLRRVESGE